MLILFLWLADVATKFSEIVGLMCFIVFVGTTLGYVFVKLSVFERIYYQDLKGLEAYETLGKQARNIWVVSVIVGIIILFIPSKGTLYTIAGVYAGQQIIESEKVNSLLDKTYILIEQKLDEVIENDKSN